MKPVVIFRNELLPASETFIAAQAAALRRYSPCFAGLKRVPGGLPLDESRVVSLTGSRHLKDKLLYAAYLHTGIAPDFHRRVRSIHPALLHAHFAVDACAALPLQKQLQVPMLVTLHGYDILRSDEAHSLTRPGRLYLDRRSEMLRVAQLFLCVSEHIRHSAIERGFPREKLVVLRIGIPLPDFEAEPQAPLAAEPQPVPIVLFVGRMVEKKGCIHLLRAMGQVEAKRPGSAAGSNRRRPLAQQLKNFATAQRRSVTFLGVRSPPEVRQWMRRARVLAAPGITAQDGDAEGLPTVLCEAQALGLPIVAFAGQGVKEAVVPDETALLAAPRDEDALAGAILRLIEDDFLHHRLSEAGRKHASQLFDIQKQTALLEEQYDRVLDRSPSLVQ